MSYNFAFRASAEFADILDDYIKDTDPSLSRSAALRLIFEEWANLTGRDLAASRIQRRSGRENMVNGNRLSSTVTLLHQLPMQEFSDRVSQADRIDALSSWALPLKYTLLDMPPSTKVQILIMKPNSQIAKQRSLDAQQPRTYARDTIQKFIRILKEGHYLERPDFLVKCYTMMPPFRYYRMDNVIYVGWFFRSTMNNLLATPHLRVDRESDSELFEHLSAEFELFSVNSHDLMEEDFGEDT